MKKFNLILTASLIAALAVSTAAFAKPEMKKAEPPHAEQSVKAHEKAPAKLAPAKHGTKEKAFAAPAPAPAKHEAKQKAPAKPAPVKHEAKKSPHLPPQKVTHHSSKTSDIIAIAAALLRLSS